jgi:hypothetical protein
MCYKVNESNLSCRLSNTTVNHGISTVEFIRHTGNTQRHGGFWLLQAERKGLMRLHNYAI